MKVEVDLYQDWLDGNIQEIKVALNEGYYFSVHKDWQNRIANGDEITDLGIRERLLLLNLCRCYRQVPARKRLLKVCRDVVVPPERSRGWSDFVKEIVDGTDLNRRLSRQSLDIDSQDKMLNHWRIQHFHIGVGPDAKHPMLIQGESEIVYAYVTPEVLYVIDVAEHGKWAQQQLLEKLDRDYPEALAPYLTNALDISWEADEEDYKRLRKLNLNTMLKINGKIFVEPGVGVACDGTPSQVVMFMLRVRRRLDKCCQMIKQYFESTVCVDTPCQIGVADVVRLRMYGFDNRYVYVCCKEHHCAYKISENAVERV